MKLLTGSGIFTNLNIIQNIVAFGMWSQKESLDEAPFHIALPYQATFHENQDPFLERILGF